MTNVQVSFHFSAKQRGRVETAINSSTAHSYFEVQLQLAAAPGGSMNQVEFHLPHVL